MDQPTSQQPVSPAQSAQPVQPPSLPTVPPKHAEVPADKAAIPARTPASMIIFLLLAFPPAAWFLMWIDKSYHHWFAKLLILSGAAALAYTIFSYATIGIQITELYKSLGVQNTNEGTIRTATILGGVFA